MLSKSSARIAGWLCVIALLAGGLPITVRADALSDFQSASGLTAVTQSGLFTVLAQAALAVGLCWVLVAAIRNWIRRDKDAMSVFFIVGRCFIMAVGIGAFLLLFD